MSYNYYCYGQIQDKDGKWVALSEKPLSDNLKYYIDFDDVPDCFERVFWDQSEKALELGREVIPVFAEQFKDIVKYGDAFYVRLDKFISYFQSKAETLTAKMTGMLNCMGIEGDINWYDADEIYTLMDRNEGYEKKKSVPVAKSALFELIKCVIEFNKISYLLNLAQTFETMAYDIDDFSNEKKSFLIIME